VKRALAILCGLVLICAQWSFAASAQAVDPSAACTRCPCRQLSCCPAPYLPTSPAPPASQQTGQSHQEARTAPSATTVVLYAQAVGDAARCPDSLSLPRSLPVPLYQRTCSYVI